MSGISSFNDATMRWKAIKPNDAKIGDYVKGITWTNSQKYGDDYNFTVIGTVTTESSEAYNIEIETSEGEIISLAANVGTSGGNAIYKAVDKRAPRGIFKHLLARQLTNKNRRFNSNISRSRSRSRTISPSRSRSRSRSRRRSRSRSRTISPSRSRTSGGKLKRHKNTKKNKL